MVTDTPSCLRFLYRKSAGENELATHCYLSPQAKKKEKKSGQRSFTFLIS